MTMANQIMAFGEILWDMLPGGKQLGGAPGNFAYHCHVLGSDAMIVSRIGNDDLGRGVTDELRKRSIPTDFIGIDFERPTGTVEVELDRLGQPAYQIIEDVAWDRIKPSKAALVYASGIDAICFGSLALRSSANRVALASLLAAVPEGKLKVLDLNLRAPFYSAETVRSLLPLANVLKLNDEELIQLGNLLGRDFAGEPFFAQNGEKGTTLSAAPAAFVEELFTRLPLRYLILTCGAKGSFIIDRTGRSSYRPTVPAEVVSSVGAGDAFSAVCVNGFLAGDDLDAVNERASQYAAYICTQPGAMPTVEPILLQKWGF